jgi:hypothetical protein
MVVLAIATLAVIGAVVGTIHGLVLVWLVQSRHSQQSPNHGTIQG